MSGILWSRRPSAPDAGSGSAHIPPRPRTTSGGLSAFASAFSLSKAKSRERLRTQPAKSSSNRQTVVSTESGSSDMWNEPTTPSSASDTKQSFQGAMGVGIGGDDPFARLPVHVSKDKPDSPVPSLAAFPDPPRRPRTATQRNNSTGPLLFPDPGPSRHLHPPSVSPKSSSSKLSPKSSSRASSPNRSRSTSASSSAPPAKPPRTPPPMISSVSPADMHAHADAVSWSPESMYDPDVDPRQYGEQENREGSGIRRGQSAHAVLSPSTRLAPAPRLVHSASSSHLSAPPTPGPHLAPPGVGRAGYSAVSGMGSMTALASGIVRGLEDDGDRKKLPQRPSRSELRPRTSAASLTTHIVPPRRKESLGALRESSARSPQSPDPTRSESLLDALDPTSLSVLDPASRSVLEPTPRSPESILKALESVRSPRSSGSTPDASAVSTPNAISPPRPRTASSPCRPQTVTSPRPGTALSPRRHPASPRLGPSPASPRLGPSPSSLHPLHPGPSSPRLNPSSPRLNSSSPRLNPSSPRLQPFHASSPPTRLSEESLEDLDNYHFTIAPAIQEGDAQSISFSELGVQLGDDEDVWSDDGLTFHHGGTDSLHYVSADSPRYGRRPPPSPTSLPFMAGNVRRRPRQDMVYPSGVHTIPISDQYALAKMGKEEDFKVGKEEDAVVGQSQVELDASACIQEEHERLGSSPSPSNPLERISTLSAGSQTSSCSSIAPDAVPPQTISSHVMFSKHARTGSYSDSELEFELSSRSGLKPKHGQSTQTAVAWRCGAGNHEKCCQTRAMHEANIGQYKCCADRTPSGKNARCCASFIGRPCERPRVSSTSSASVNELKRQRSLHFPGIPGPVPGGSKRNHRGFFHRPHTSHGKSTSSALLDEETKAIIQSKTREDPGPQSPTSDVFATPAPASSVASPPTSPVSRHEFQARPIISRAKLNDHLKEARVSVSPAPTPDPLKSPKLEPTRARSNTSTTESGSVRSVFSSPSGDAPPLMRALPARPRRNQNVSLPPMTTSQLVQQPRRYVQSITSVVQPSTGLSRPPRSPTSGVGLSSLSSGSIASGSSLGSTPGFSPVTTGSGLPAPPRRHATGRINAQPIVSFISSRSAPTPHTTSDITTAGLRHRSSRESYESSRTVRKERSIPLRENQMSFLEFGVEEEESEEEEEPQPHEPPSRPTLQHTQSFLDLSSRQSGDTMRETAAMFTS